MRVALVLLLAAGAQAEATSIYTCIDAHGRRLTADRPIPACNDREQQRLNRDGSVQAVIGASPTADERAAKEAAERRAASERAAQRDAVRRDRNLLMRYRDEATHQHSREAALAPLAQALLAAEQRLAALGRERRALLEEAEFYRGRPLPLRLQQGLDANEAGAESQRTMMQNQRAEIVRINALFDAELQRLRRLWAGAPPGSMGPAPVMPGQQEPPRRAVARP